MGANDLTPPFAVDIVFCIDCTGSMIPYLASVKKTAAQFDVLLAEAMEEKGKRTSQTRVRVVAYRDIDHDGADAMLESPFFTLPDQVDDFKAFVDGLQARGGGDEPESGLEALAFALASDWERHLDRRRHVVVVCTDASAHPLGTAEKLDPNAGVPGSLEDLQAIWGDAVDEGQMEYKAKRLVLFAPDMPPWNTIAERWENVVWFPSRATAGLREKEQREVLEQIAGSV